MPGTPREPALEVLFVGPQVVPMGRGVFGFVGGPDLGASRGRACLGVGDEASEQLVAAGDQIPREVRVDPAVAFVLPTTSSPNWVPQCATRHTPHRIRRLGDTAARKVVLLSNRRQDAAKHSAGMNMAHHLDALHQAEGDAMAQ